MAILGWAIFGVVDWAARHGLAESTAPQSKAAAGLNARRTGVRGETYAYWYLRKNGYVMIARNFSQRGIKGEIDLVGYDGKTLAFVEVKTRTSARNEFGTPEDAVTSQKKKHLSQMARQFVREYRASGVPYRFDILAIEAPSGRRPSVRLHKGAFAPL
ncbi:MAG TPA: YraN family protein [Candidatus Acidoferrales bacterium]|nr:YraN family protein [Candidatus Acidoferrales bacterium]